MNIRLLKKLSNDIKGGNGLRAIFWANEYLQANHPLRIALVTQAGLSADNSALAQKATRGVKVQELNETEQQELGLVTTPSQSVRPGRQLSTVTPRRRSQNRRSMPGREVYQLRKNKTAQRQELRRAL